MRVLILNGPNLNLLGTREPEIYGTLSLEEINDLLTEYWFEQVTEGTLDFVQTNHEGVMVDTLQDATGNYDAVILNAAAYTHYSIALRDAIAAIDVPVVEVHLSDPDSREDFRRNNVIREVCAAHFAGDGAGSYKSALDHLLP
ncbi:MAG: 3-dehydroquinate dehydratase [Coriobacteriia bacterium]|nr:3-dehydroquinate dehydratase [Coriobacteriia bacterium]MCL2536689.1 3-dehydroquinate dehydratase [Coriobacteriia bacterium]